MNPQARRARDLANAKRRQTRAEQGLPPPRRRMSSSGTGALASPTSRQSTTPDGDGFEDDYNHYGDGGNLAVLLTYDGFE